MRLALIQVVGTERASQPVGGAFFEGHAYSGALFGELLDAVIDYGDLQDVVLALDESTLDLDFRREVERRDRLKREATTLLDHSRQRTIGRPSYSASSRDTRSGNGAASPRDDLAINRIGDLQPLQAGTHEPQVTNEREVVVQDIHLLAGLFRHCRQITHGIQDSRSPLSNPSAKTGPCAASTSADQ